MIGIFDSGVGGMTVARAVERIIPDRQVVYFGDLARTPYGSKSPETIMEYARQNTEFLIAQGAKLVIIACNTAACIAGEQLRREYDIPILEVITPAIEMAVASTGNKRVGIIGTHATISSGVYENKIKKLSPEVQVFSEACPLFVPLVEEGWLHKRETKMIVRRYLHPLKLKQIDTLVLGCTHYPLLKGLIQPRIGKRVRIIDSSLAVADNLRTLLKSNQDIATALSGKGDNAYYVSDITTAADAITQKIFGRKIELLKVKEI